MKFILVLLLALPLLVFGQELPEVPQASIMDFILRLGPIVALLISELMALIPGLKSKGILVFILRLLGFLKQK